MEPRFTKPNQGVRLPPRQGQGLGQGQVQPRTQLQGRQSEHPSQGSNFRKYGNQVDSRLRTQERKAFGAAEVQEEDDCEETQAYEAGRHAFSASRLDDEEGGDEEEDRFAMMGRRDYQYNGSEDDDEEQA